MIRRPTTTTGECGTYGGAQRHRKDGTPPCDGCKTALRDYAAARRFRIGFFHDPKRCRECGSVFTQHTCGGTA